MELPLQVQQLADATLKALDLPGGPEILDRMASGDMPIGDGLVALAVLSGDYERISSPSPRSGPAGG